MSTFQAILYLDAIAFLLLAAFGVPSRVSWVPLAGACALLAFSLPTIATL